MIRCLVCDDSALIRQMIRRILTEHGFQVVGIARNGQEAVDQALQLHPDVITLDVEMPVKDGLQALREIMSRLPTAVLMVSHLTAEEAPATVEALTLGAVDVVLKPGSADSIFRSLAAWEEELVRKVRLASRARPRRFQVGGETAPGSAPLQQAPPGAAAAQGSPLVVIGASTGGPGTLSEIFARLSPSDLPAAILVVQHMPPGFTSSLARRLNQLSRFRVEEAYDGATLQPGVAWVAPGGHHLVLRPNSHRIALVDTVPRHGVRPAIDTTLESVAAEHHGPTVVAILTGMGADGAVGARLIRQHGGKVVAQDEATSVVYGMPKVVAEWGEADEIRPLPEIADCLVRLMNQLTQAASPASASGGPACTPPSGPPHLLLSSSAAGITGSANPPGW